MSETVVLQREYAASPERVFEAWTNVELLTQWFGCGPNMLWTVHEWDVRVGGQLYVSLMFDHGPFEVRGEFLVVDPPRHLRYRFGSEQFVDATIEPHQTGSRLTVQHSGLPDQNMCNIISGGWSNGLSQFGALLQSVVVINPS
jgi:uncharacterized protein YndB with AHSA1/START domain